METVTVKLPKVVYDGLPALKAKLIAHGKQVLPEDFWDKTCLFCKVEMINEDAKDYHACPGCGFVKFIPEGDDLAFLSRTALMTLAVYALARTSEVQ